MASLITYSKGKINRRYSHKWNELNGPQYAKAIEIVKGQLSQREHMIDYIDELHKTIDRLNKRIIKLRK